MSQAYDHYLLEHVANVQKGLDWMSQHGIISGGITATLHDKSKWDPEEYDAYDDYFYGREGRDEDDIEVIDCAFNYAWLHHIHQNPHHWQHWLLIQDEGKIIPLMMPERTVYEMIADWWSFSWKSGNLLEIFRWYEDHKEKMKLHPKTRKLVEDILVKIRDVLEEEEEN